MSLTFKSSSVARPDRPAGGNICLRGRLPRHDSKPCLLLTLHPAKHADQM